MTHVFPPTRPLEVMPPAVPSAPDLIIPRADEEGRVDAALKEMLNGNKPEKSIFHIWGAGGVGKTTLLSRLHSLHQRSERVTTRFIDCNSIRDLDHMRRQISRQPWEDWITGLSHAKPLLLLLDNVERFERGDPPIAFAQFEDQVLEPLAQLDAAVIVLCSRWELRRFNRFDVRWRTDKAPRELALFSPAQTADLVQRAVQPAEPVGMLGLETISTPRHTPSTGTRGGDQPPVPFAQEVYAYSAGHPLVAAELARRWGELPGDEAEKRRQIGGWLNSLRARLLPDIPEPLQDRLRVIATLRGFHISLYRAFMEKLQAQQAQADDEGVERDLQGKSEGEIQNRLNQLTATHLVYWSSEDHSYIVAPSVRLFLSRLLWTTDLARYGAYHQAAFEVYAHKFGSHATSGETRFFIEALYHLVEVAASCTTPACPCQKNIEWMQQWAEEYHEPIQQMTADGQRSLVEIRQRAGLLREQDSVRAFLLKTFPFLILPGDDIRQ